MTKCHRKCNNSDEHHAVDQHDQNTANLHEDNQENIIRVHNKKCASVGCDKTSIFNFLGFLFGIFCREHKKEHMFDVAGKTCAHEDGCDIRYSYFNFPWETKGVYCATHAKQDMINVVSVNKKCIEKDCNTQPSYNLLGEKPLFCMAHAKEGMINVITKRCVWEEGCDKIPCFNSSGELRPLYCFDHKKDGMIDVTHKKCIADGCDILPSCNLPNKKKALFCATHKLEGMVDVVNKKCIDPECGTFANFNFPGKQKLYCADHKKDGMVDVVNKTCAEKDCMLHPTFNYQGKKRLYCFKHKKENMIDVTHKNCADEECNKRAYFNFSNETLPLYCFDHKKENMISTTRKKCQFTKCKTPATYGFIGNRKQFCEEHQQPNMVNLDNEYKCSMCEKTYEFMVNNKKYCLEHHPDKTIEISIKRICQICDIEQQSNYICKDCRRLSNKKEWAIVRYIKKHIKKSFFHNSSQPVKECSNRRPDIFFELDTHIVIVEIDENQHKSYLQSCEYARICEMVGSIGGKPVIIIRYNPDKIYHKKKEIKFSLEDKLETLICVIKRELKQKYDHFFVLQIKLFFDDKKEEYEKIKITDITTKVSV